MNPLEEKRYHQWQFAGQLEKSQSGCGVREFRPGTHIGVMHSGSAGFCASTVHLCQSRAKKRFVTALDRCESGVWRNTTKEVFPANSIWLAVFALNQGVGHGFEPNRCITRMQSHGHRKVSCLHLPKKQLLVSIK
ncbi:MAG: hypothetical protein JSR94_08555 [Proteobacteria bacterium]|nr:hypothetical protein [Pseudomonadota bacterium]HMZ09308.1 hypothetical protein [Plasticicumulans sp.]